MYHVVQPVDNAKNSPGFHSGKVEIPYTTLGTSPPAPPTHAGYIILVTRQDLSSLDDPAYVN
jgi:hypothetical protein